ncbi:hypothetical protein OK074_4034 [Actinobacteria bacterium OK074]|nr:hypothetical protein OK074_4034 [Actinobacteria bacterium OK074]
MAERSPAVPPWALVSLTLWFLTRLLPATGTRRKASTVVRTVLTCWNVADPARLAVSVPFPRRSPYSCDRAPLDGTTSPLSRPYLRQDTAVPAPATTRTARVRPYWTARERVARWGRRTALVCAADFGLDLDVRDIHAVAAAGGALR